MNVEELKKLAKELPQHQPSETRSKELRVSLLAAVAEQGPGRSRQSRAGQPLWAPVAALAMVAGLAFYVGRQQGASAPAAPILAAAVSGVAVVSSAPAKEEAMAPAVSAPPAMNWEQGRLAVDTSKEGYAGKKIRLSNALVAAISSEAGAQQESVFFVDAQDGRLRDVSVVSGRVSVRMHDQAVVVLAAGQSLRQQLQFQQELLGPIANGSPEAQAASEIAPEPSVKKSFASGSPKRSRRRPRSRLVARYNSEESMSAKEENIDRTASKDPQEADSEIVSSPEPSAGELAFAAGYRAVRRGDYGSAVADLETAIATGENRALQGDSRYWRVVALARSGRRALASEAMVEFLRLHGSSARAGEVATMLGWIRAQQGDAEGARLLFGRGSSDRSAAVRKSALEGLGALKKAMQSP